MTLASRVIACLDVTDGRVVKGVNFTDLVDAGDPVEMAKVYNLEGVDELTFLDISASNMNRATTLDVVSRTAEEVFIPLTVGGGIRSVADVDNLLRAGADKISINTAAITRPELISEIVDRFGSQVLVLSRSQLTNPFFLNPLRLRHLNFRRHIVKRMLHKQILPVYKCFFSNLKYYKPLFNRCFRSLSRQLNSLRSISLFIQFIPNFQL